MPEKLTLERWNELIADINALVDECAGVSPLDEVSAPHKWSKSDIWEMQDKLVEVCEDNEFDGIPDKWKQRVISEFEDAIAAGACCCEEEDKDDFPNDLSSIFISSSSEGTYRTFDWAKWIMQVTQALTITSVECPGELEPGDEFEIEVREGGIGYVGKQFTRWQMWLYNSLTGPVDPIREGDIVHGYIDLGEGEWQPNPSCENPDPGGGTLLGTVDPAWGQPYNTEQVTTGTGPSGIQGFWRVTGADGREFTENFNADVSQFVTGGPLVAAWPTSPHVLRVAADGQVLEITQFLRLLCD